MHLPVEIPSGWFTTYVILFQWDSRWGDRAMKASAHGGFSMSLLSGPRGNHEDANSRGNVQNFLILEFPGNIEMAELVPQVTGKFPLQTSHPKLFCLWVNRTTCDSVCDCAVYRVAFRRQSGRLWFYPGFYRLGHWAERRVFGWPSGAWYLILHVSEVMVRKHFVGKQLICSQTKMLLLEYLVTEIEIFIYLLKNHAFLVSIFSIMNYHIYVGLELWMRKCL